MPIEELKMEQDEYEVELLDTVLFPEGGGQPSDTGTMKIIGSSEVINVKEVLRKNLDCLHFVDKPVEVGAVVKVDLNVEGRRDKMSQHTGQHVSE